MIRFLRKLWKDRRGNALVMIALGLPLLVGSAGLATDTIQWAVWKRQLQRAADSAALAGVHAIVLENYVDGCASGSTVAYDLTKNNKVLLGNSNTSCAVENSPTSGAYTGDPNAVKVTLSVQKRLGFSSMFMSAAPVVRASATATVVATGQYCVISLEPTNATGLTFQGNATVDLGCGMKTNSKGTCATDAGGSAEVTSTPVSAVGGICNGTGVFGTDTVLQPYSAPQDDPFASINAPAPSSFPSGNCPNLDVGTNDNFAASDIRVNVNYKLMSGSTNMYCVSRLRVQGTAVLPNGVYVIDGGDFFIGAQANLRCDECTFVLTNRNTTGNTAIGKVDMAGGATVNLSYSNVSPYAGMLFYQDRRATLATGAGQSSQINGNSSSSFAGSFYFPSTQVIFNGTSGMTTDCVQMVGRQVTFSGNTAISNVCDEDYPGPEFDATTIRLVA